jgi:hypothetical protein
MTARWIGCGWQTGGERLPRAQLRAATKHIPAKGGNAADRRRLPTERERRAHVREFRRRQQDRTRVLDRRQRKAVAVRAVAMMVLAAGQAAELAALQAQPREQTPEARTQHALELTAMLLRQVEEMTAAAVRP